MLSKISQAQKDIPYDITYMWNLKTKANAETELIDTENRLSVARGKRWG